MKTLFQEREQPNRVCLRKLAGAVCIIFGITIMLIRVIYYIVEKEVLPIEGRGQFLVGTGATLLGITSFDGVLANISNKSIK